VGNIAQTGEKLAASLVATPAFARAAGLPTRRSPRAWRIAREAGKA